MSPDGLGRVAAAWAADAGGLGRLARQHDVALVHTNTSVTLGGSAAARIAGVPHVWHVREIYTGFERWWPAYRRLLLTADALPCVSSAVAAQFRDARVGGLVRGQGTVRVLFDGLAVDARRRERTEARAELGLPAGAFVCAVLGRLSAWKGQEVLLRALAAPALAERGAVGLVCGEPRRGDERRERELRELAGILGLDDRARFLGFREDVHTILGAADVVVVPSTRPDPLPNAALEAAAAGCCVVAAAHGGSPEMLRDGETGVLVEPGSAAALAEALAGLAGDPARRERLGAAAASDVPGRFAPETLAAGAQALYDELLA